MSIFKRGEIWWVRFSTPDGRRIRRSAGTADKVAAQEYHDQLKAQMWRVSRLGEKPDYTWDQAVVQWLKEKGLKASLDKDKSIFRWLDPWLRGKKLKEIDRPLLSQIAEAKAAQTNTSTANRHLALVRSVLRRACHEWEWVDKVSKVPMFTVRNKRIRWITRQEADRLLAELPAHQAAMARFGLATGLRQRNVCRLAWRDVDLFRKACWVHADQAKARKAIAVPLNADAMAVLKQQMGEHEQWVFTYGGKPVWQVNTKAWRKAVKAAGLTDFRWHDLRHTWASWHVQNGTPLNVLQEMGGWASYEMVLRYAHLSAAHLLPHAERIVQSSESTVPPDPGTNVAQVAQQKVVDLRKYLI